MALTELNIKYLKPKAKPYRVKDDGNLVLEVTPSGSKLWRWRFDFQGKEQLLAIGKYPAVSLAEARRKRDEARIMVQAGKHPTREKKLQKLRKAYEDNNTFERIAREALQNKHGRINEKYRIQSISRMKQLVFPEIGALPIKEITIPDVVRVLEKIAGRGTLETAKRVKQIISQTFRYAAQRGLCAHNPASDLRDILPSPVRSHFPCIPLDEVPKLLRAIEARDNDLGKYAVQLLAYTFVRTGELIGAKWEEIHWKEKEWHIPAERMKMKRPHVVPLSQQALEILREVQKRTGEKYFIFFSAASKNKHISNGTVLMQLRRMKYQNRMTGHGFRTLASTILHEQGYATDVIERQLAHEDKDKVRAAYNRAEYMPERKQMMQDYANTLDNLRKQKKSAKIIDIKRSLRRAG